MLMNKESIKKKDATAGAENKKKIPIFKVKNPNINGFILSGYLKMCINLILKLN